MPALRPASVEMTPVEFAAAKPLCNSMKTLKAGGGKMAPLEMGEQALLMLEG